MANLHSRGTFTSQSPCTTFPGPWTALTYFLGNFSGELVGTDKGLGHLDTLGAGIVGGDCLCC